MSELGRREARRVRLLAAVAIAAVGLAAPLRALAGGTDALLSWSPLRCPLALLAGLPCPTCGLGHALLEAASGDFDAALAHHPLGPPLLAVGLGAAFALLQRPARLVAMAGAIARLPQSRPRASFAACVLYALWGVARAGGLA